MAGSTDSENLIAGMNQVVKAINDLILQVTVNTPGSGTGGGTCGCGIPEDTVIDPPPADPGNPEEEEPPPGFETWEEYQTYKCKAANKIADDLIGTCQNMTGFPGLIGGMSTGITYMVIQAAFFQVGPAAIAEGLIALGLASATGITVLISALVVLVILSFSALAYFSTLAAALTDDKEEIVCILFEADSVEAARSGLLDKIDSEIVGFEDITEGISNALNSVLSALLGTAVFNTLFEPNETVSEYVGTVECDTCGCVRFTPDGESLPKEASTIVSISATEITLEGGHYLDRTRYDVGLTINGTSYGSWCGPNMEIQEWDLVSGTVEAGVDVTCHWYVYDNTGDLVYDDCTPPTLPICGAYVVTTSAVAHSWHLKVGATCEV